MPPPCRWSALFPLTVLLVSVNVPVVADAAAAEDGTVPAHRAVGKRQCADVVEDAAATAVVVSPNLPPPLSSYCE